MNTSVIYCHINKINGKRYIGKTNNISARWGNEGGAYLYGRGKNTIFANAIKKYGWDNFEHIILEDGLTDAEASEREKYYIELYKTNIAKYGNSFGYNMTDGGEGATGRVISDETREKLRVSHLGYTVSEETKNKISQSLKGRDTLSKEARKRLGQHNSVVLKGRKLPPEQIEKIRQSSKERGISELARQRSREQTIKAVINIDTGEVFSCMKDACEKYNISATHISAACRGRRKTAKGYRWKYCDKGDGVMEKKFIYVFDEKSRDLLLAQGFIPVKFDEQNNIFAFHNQEIVNFTFSEVIHLFTDTITF